MKCNERVRRAARAEGIPLWRIASEMAVSEPTITRWLRTPLSPEKEEKMLAVIIKLAKEMS